jgi:hypothetical protein
MTMLDKLEHAKTLLADVYHSAIESGDQELEQLLSAADSCIVEAIDGIKSRLIGD